MSYFIVTFSVRVEQGGLCTGDCYHTSSDYDDHPIPLVTTVITRGIGIEIARYATPYQ